LTVVDKGGEKDEIGKFKPFEMGMQVSCGIYLERAEERVVWDDTGVFWGRCFTNWHGRRGVR
jgi:hypothetical protein